jgi:hypothetical protein
MSSVFYLSALRERRRDEARQDTIGGVATFRVEYLMGGVIRDIGVRRMDFPDLSIHKDKSQVMMCTRSYYVDSAVVTAGDKLKI